MNGIHWPPAFPRAGPKSRGANNGDSQLRVHRAQSGFPGAGHAPHVLRLDPLGPVFVLYFGFILLVAFAPKFLGTPIGSGVMTIGIPIGLFVIVSAFVLTGLYVRKANSEYDALVRRIVEEAK